MNKSLHTVTIPVRDYEYLMNTNNTYIQLMQKLRGALIYSEVDPNSIVIDKKKLIDIYKKDIANIEGTTVILI